MQKNDFRIVHDSSLIRKGARQMLLRLLENGMFENKKKADKALCQAMINALLQDGILLEHFLLGGEIRVNYENDKPRFYIDAND